MVKPPLKPSFISDIPTISRLLLMVKLPLKPSFISDIPTISRLLLMVKPPLKPSFISYIPTISRLLLMVKPPLKPIIYQLYPHYIPYFWWLNPQKKHHLSAFISYIPVCFLFLFSTGGSHHPAIVGLGMEDLAEMVDALVSVGETAHLKANSFHWGISLGNFMLHFRVPGGNSEWNMGISERGYFKWDLMVILFGIWWTCRGNSWDLMGGWMGDALR